jgi:hypothetical protein
MNEYIRNYLQNRADFYTVLLPRILPPAFREQLASAVMPLAAPDSLLQIMDTFVFPDKDAEIFRGLILHDLLKKNTFGSASGRTAISYDDALQRSVAIEEFGTLLFRRLCDCAPVPPAPLVAEYEHHVRALASLLELDDQIRYRKGPLFGR